jgi:MarR family 2-MHQ and catechol resistance regulon transcriptional repressor
VKQKKSISWIDVDHRPRSYEVRNYMRIVAEARYVFRTVQRIIDECAKGHGVEPLEYQALLQIFGAHEQKLSIGHLAERLNIVSALASRLVQQLERRGLVARTRSQKDRRATYVSATKPGERLIRLVFDDVHDEVDYFRFKVTVEQRQAAHEITAFYVGSHDKSVTPRSKYPLRSSPVPRSAKLTGGRSRRS